MVGCPEDALREVVLSQVDLCTLWVFRTVKDDGWAVGWKLALWGTRCSSSFSVLWHSYAVGGRYGVLQFD